MTNLFLDRILEFYGVPQILVAKDSFGTQYLCLLFDDGAGCKYTGIKISSSRLDDYWGGRIDLRTLYLNPENDNEYPFSGSLSSGKAFPSKDCSS